MNQILLRNGTLLDPHRGVQENTDILIERGKLARIGRGISLPIRTEELDMAGKWIMPGIIDLHAHQSEPQRLDRETIASLGRAAAAGGITSAVIRPNADMPLDNIALVEFLRSKANRETRTRFFPVSATTIGRKGERLIEIGEMASTGVVATGDDTRSYAQAEIVRRAMEYARMFDLPYFSFPSDPSLAGRGVINEGYVSMMLGLEGIPASAEEIIVIRDIILAREAKCHLHIGPVTTAASVELVRRAKGDGLDVTAETHPHFFILTENACAGYDTDTKVDPPLRTERDLLSVRQGLVDGTIDIIASGHTPLSIVDKDLEFDTAVPGISGIEIMLPLCVTCLIKEGIIYPEMLAKLLSAAPAALLGQSQLGRLEIGAVADLTVIDPNLTKEVDPTTFKGRGRNTPFEGVTLTGWAIMTIVAGQIVMSNGELQYSL